MSNWITLSQYSGTSGTTVINVTANASEGQSRISKYKIATNDEEKEFAINFIQESDSSHSSPYFTVFYNATGSSTIISTPLREGGLVRAYRVDSGPWRANPSGASSVVPRTYSFGTTGIHRIDYLGAPADDGLFYVAELWFKEIESIVSVIVPDGYNGIKPSAFSGCTNLSEADIGETVSSIKDYAFANTNLHNFSFPNNVKSVERGVLMGCQYLTSVTFSDYTYEIEENALAGCNSLPSIVFPNFLESTEPGAFRNCTSLNGIELPSSLSYLGASTFAGDVSAGGVIIIPENVLSLYGSTFKGTSFEDIILPVGLLQIGSYCFADMPYVTIITIPDNVRRIDAYCFSGCANLSKIIIGENVCKLGDYLFKDCANLTEIYAYPAISPMFTTSTFSYLNTTGTLHYPIGSDYSAILSRLPNWTGIPDL